MAKRRTASHQQGNSRSIQRGSSSRRERSGNASGGEHEFSENNYREILKDFITSPTVKYIAGGLAAAFLTRLANNMSDKYPEFSNFIRENMDTLENKLSELRSGSLESQETTH